MADQDVSLSCTLEGRVVFTSTGKWLHPLFELEAFFAAAGTDGSGCELRDKVVGRGSAFLMKRLGAARVHAVLLSRLGKDVLDTAGIPVTWDRLVDEIQCATEGLLRDVTDTEQAYAILSERRARALARDAAKAAGGA
jgi:hypothetical protein